MKKPLIFCILLMIVASSLLAYMWLPKYIGSYSIMTKPVESFDALKTHFQETGVKTPQYYLQKDNPYLHVATQEIVLSRLEQRGPWEAYSVTLTPTKLSKSHFFKIVVSGTKKETLNEEDETTIVWNTEDMTPYFSSDEGYPQGAYHSLIGAFEEGGITYQIEGLVFGDFNEMTKKSAVLELEGIMSSLK